MFNLPIDCHKLPPSLLTRQKNTIYGLSNTPNTQLMDMMRLNHLIQPNIIKFKQGQLRIQLYYKNKTKYNLYIKSKTPCKNIKNYD